MSSGFGFFLLAKDFWNLLSYVWGFMSGSPGGHQGQRPSRPDKQRPRRKKLPREIDPAPSGRSR